MRAEALVISRECNPVQQRVGAVTANHSRLRSEVGKQSMRRRTENTLSIVIYAVADLGCDGDCSILVLTVTGVPT